jgi:hypothetical protein
MQWMYETHMLFKDAFVKLSDVIMCRAAGNLTQYLGRIID